jgi:hypothetical protein
VSKISPEIFTKRPFGLERVARPLTTPEGPAQRRTPAPCSNDGAPSTHSTASFAIMCAWNTEHYLLNLS